MTGIELLAVVFKGAGNANTVRKLLLEPTVMEQAASAIAEVGDETARRLLAEATSLPEDERETTFHQVALLLEQASTADGNAMSRRRFPRSPGTADLQRYTERLIWLAAIYRVLGHHSLAQLRVRRARERLPDVEKLMDLDIYRMIFITGVAPGHANANQIAARQAIRRRKHNKTLAELAAACERVENLRP